jgi:3'-phosphoadenosine 5'-phosphosulfate sulfotransferase (PAPS reductase)/FAD synthetase
VNDQWLSEFRRIPRPTVVNFSGGRTSGLMLRLYLDAHNGKLLDDARVIFANTGKEAPETLDFVQECSERWAVPILWIEYDPDSTEGHQWRTVSHNSASRNGEPFAALIGKRNALPNPVARMCTEALKVRPVVRYTRDVLGWPHYHSVIGIRADEPRRVARILSCGGKTRDRHTRHIPLHHAGITRADVKAFWQAQPFDLRLQMTPDGTTPGGNCDLCFLKGMPNILGAIRRNPESARWWIEQESRPIEARSASARHFRVDRPSYAQMLAAVEAQVDLFGEGYDLEASDCNCTD